MNADDMAGPDSVFGHEFWVKKLAAQLRLDPVLLGQEWAAGSGKAAFVDAAIRTKSRMTDQVSE